MIGECLAVGLTLSAIAAWLLCTEDGRELIRSLRAERNANAMK